MLTEEEIKRYTELQQGGLALGQDLISNPEAIKLTGKTFRSISQIRADKPAEARNGYVTWWIVGSIIMLDKKSLIQVALARGWIEEV